MIVLDCNAALEMAKQTEMGLYFQRLAVPEEEIIAPDLFCVEVVNAAWKHVHARVLDEAGGRTLMDDALAIPDRLIPTVDLLAEAYGEAAALDHSVYDMVYLVLARRCAATLFTRDKRLQECCIVRNVDCVWETEL